MRYYRRLELVSSTAKFLAPRLRNRNPVDAADRFKVERLPAQYQKFYNEWKADTAAVHWIPKTGNFERNPKSGVVSVVRERPIPVIYPHQSDVGMWGGEGIIEGLIKKGKYKRPVPKYWVPRLVRSVVHSEILDKYMSLLVTDRTLKLIDESQGFDSYLLKTPANELRSLLALKLKRRVLLNLATRNFALTDPKRHTDLLETYKDIIIPVDEIEWYGLTIAEAKAKYQAEREAEKVKKIQPLKFQFRMELIEELKAAALKKQEEMAEPKSPSSTNWLRKLNPFVKPEGADAERKG